MAVAGSASEGALASPGLDQTGRGTAPDDGGPERRPAAARPAIASSSATAANGSRAVAGGADAAATAAAAAAAGGGNAAPAADASGTGRGRGPCGGASPPQPPPPPSAASVAARSASPAPGHGTMFSPSASARATAAAVTEQRLQQLIRERAGLEPHRSRWPATWALLEGEVARLCRLANAAGVAAAVAAGSGGGAQGGGGGELSAAGGGVSRSQVQAVGDPLSAGGRGERLSPPSADAYGLGGGGGIAGIPQDMQEVQAAGAVAAGRASPAAQLMGRRWTPETPLSLMSSPAPLGVHGGHGGEEQLPQLTVSAYGSGGGDGGGAAYGLSPAPGVSSAPVPAGTQASSTKQRVRLLVPSEKYPDFNFVGRILGPRGATLKALERTTSCKIMIRGRGSIRRDKEAEVRGKPGWEHCFNDPLHVIIEADAADEAAATRALNRAKEAVELLLVPVPEERDSLKRQQLRDLAIINGACRAADAAAAAAAAAAVGKAGEGATGGGPALAHLSDESLATSAPPMWTPPPPVTPVFGGRYSGGPGGPRSMAPRGAFPSDMPQQGMLGGQAAYGGGAPGVLGGPYGGRQTSSAMAAAPPMVSPLPLVSPQSITPSGGGDGSAAWSFAESVSNISLDGGLTDPASSGSGGGSGGVSGGGGAAFGGEAADQRHLDLQFEARPDVGRPSPDTPVTAPAVKALVPPSGGTPVATGVGSGGFMSQDFYGGAFSDYGRGAEARGWSSPTEVLSAPPSHTGDHDRRPAV